MVSLIQSQKHGVSIADTLRIQAQEMRVKRRQMIEEKSAKLTVKMIFPIVVCFLPVFFIIVAVPAVSNIFKALGRPAGSRSAAGRPIATSAYGDRVSSGCCVGRHGDFVVSRQPYGGRYSGQLPTRAARLDPVEVQAFARTAASDIERLHLWHPPCSILERSAW